MPELIEPGGGPRYNKLVCQGVAKMERGAFEEAARELEEAASIHLPDVPNFKLFSRLALAYWKAGNTAKALENLEKAKLSLLVLIGTYRCQESPRGFVLVDPVSELVQAPYVAEIRGRMCGAAYDSYSGYTDPPFDDELLERVVGDARIIASYLQARKEIAAPAHKD